MRPESRRAQLLTQSVGDELVIYDERTHQAHRLSQTAAVVWRLADGDRQLPDLTAGLRVSVSRSDVAGAAKLDDITSEELVRMALGELDRAGLLTSRLPELSALGEPMSRREMLGVAVALIPVVVSIVAPTPAMAQSPPILPPPPPPTTFFDFRPFNGTYSGNGTPGIPNVCNITARPVTLQLAIESLDANRGIGQFGIIHVGAQTFVVTEASATVLTPTSIRVRGQTLGAGTNLTSTFNDFTFTLTTPSGATATGIQNLDIPGCATTPYNITASKP